MLQIYEEMGEGYTCLNLSGKFDFYGIQAFKAALKKAEGESINHLIVDLRGIQFIDSSSLGALVLTQKRLCQTNRGISLIIDPDTGMGRVMSLSSLKSLMPTFTNRTDAVASLPLSGTQT